VDAFLTFMVETDAQAEEIPLYCEEYGVTSYKLYMQARRIPAEDHNWPSRRAGLGVGIDDGVLYRVFEQVARYGAPAICSIHPENWEIARVFEERARASGRTDLGAWTDRSPHMLEAQHVRAYAYIAEKLGTRMYIQHATTPATFAEIREARSRGVEMYAQTGPAWLGFTPNDGWRINVPLRWEDAQEELWKALARGDVDVVGSDHVVAWEPADRESMYSANIWDCRTGFSRVEPAAARPGQLREPREDLRPVPAEGRDRRRLGCGSRGRRPVARGEGGQGAPEHALRLVDHGGADLPRLARHDRPPRPGDGRVGG
jgi:dihydropyrimidinase/dihydroorotase